jgi:aminoglycoside phosphotransferase (APT) family kinase protein
MSIRQIAARAAMRARLGRRGSLAPPRRGWLSTVTPGLVAEVLPPGPGGAWRAGGVSVSSTLVTVVRVSCDLTGQQAVVKLPWTAEGARSLRRQATVLAVLHADPRLAGWCRVVPRLLGAGEIDGRPYWVEAALPGEPVTASTLRRAADRPVLAAAIRLIEDLHARTAERTPMDTATIDAWVERPLRRIGSYRDGRRRPERSPDPLPWLRAQLVTALTGRNLRTCWIHGDFWPGNLLAVGPVVTGVVDWNHAAPGQLPLHDLVHAHALAVRMATGAELGDIVVRALHHNLAEAVRAPAAQVASWLDGLPERPAILLYWLRYIALFIDSEGHRDNPRWLRGNVDRVLAHL